MTSVSHRIWKSRPCSAKTVNKHRRWIMASNYMFRLEMQLSSESFKLVHDSWPKKERSSSFDLSVGTISTLPVRVGGKSVTSFLLDGRSSRRLSITSFHSNRPASPNRRSVCTDGSSKAMTWRRARSLASTKYSRFWLSEFLGLEGS
jgi:hypothetical protein